MTWQQKIDYVDVDVALAKRRSTKKKVWDESTHTWKDVTLWTVDADRELCDWLKAEYPNFAGWKYVWSDLRVVMEEPIYIFYCLKFRN